MSDRLERKRLLLMRILKESGTPLSSQKIQEQLVARGMDISERTVRFHLQALDSQGYTVYREKKGRLLTPKGYAELSTAHVYDRVGFLSAKIDDMTYRMSYNPSRGDGSVLVNLSVVDKKHLDMVAALVPPVFASGLAHGSLLTLIDSGGYVGATQIPSGCIGLGTVCSITFNGALIQAGIPVTSVFGGLLEIHDRAPDRFTAAIRYDGTTLDPLEIYISSLMTSTATAAADGNGLIGASFREVPSSARDQVMETDALLKRRGLGGYLKLGYPSQTLLDIPVSEGRTGLVIAGGLNAVAPLVEKGIPIESKALSGLVNYRDLFPYEELSNRLTRIS